MEVQMNFSRRKEKYCARKTHKPQEKSTKKNNSKSYKAVTMMSNTNKDCNKSESFSKK
jgi:hypothetical protein